jgi:hypothetical protein
LLPGSMEAAGKVESVCIMAGEEGGGGAQAQRHSMTP